MKKLIESVQRDVHRDRRDRGINESSVTPEQSAQYVHEIGEHVKKLQDQIDRAKSDSDSGIGAYRGTRGWNALDKQEEHLGKIHDLVKKAHAKGLHHVVAEVHADTKDQAEDADDYFEGIPRHDLTVKYLRKHVKD